MPPPKTKQTEPQGPESKAQALTVKLYVKEIRKIRTKMYLLWLATLQAFNCITETERDRRIEQWAPKCLLWRIDNGRWQPISESLKQ